MIILCLDWVIKLHSTRAEIDGFHVRVFEENLIRRECFVVVLFLELIEFLVISVAFPQLSHLGVKKGVFSSQLEFILVEFRDIYRELCLEIVHIPLVALQVEGSLLVTLGNEKLSWSLSEVAIEVPLDIFLSHDISFEIFANKLSWDNLAHSETFLRIKIVPLHLSREGFTHDG